MKLSIMQPYFFPYLGYFSLIKHTDKFILFDPVQFIRHGWIERNRVLKQNEGWLYIKVPLAKHSRETLIKDIKIDNTQNWKQKIISQLQHYKKIAPNYFKVIKLLNDIFGNEYSDIVTLNKNTLQSVCNYLNIEKKLDIYSQMNLTIEKPKAPDEWALNICKAIPDANEYWNPPGGENIFDIGKFKQSNITLKFLKINPREYDQKRSLYEPGLSIIDVMMFNDSDTINAFLDNYTLY